MQCVTKLSWKWRLYISSGLGIPTCDLTLDQWHMDGWMGGTWACWMCKKSGVRTKIILQKPNTALGQSWSEGLWWWWLVHVAESHPGSRCTDEHDQTFMMPAGNVKWDPLPFLMPHRLRVLNNSRRWMLFRSLHTAASVPPLIKHNTSSSRE